MHTQYESVDEEVEEITGRVTGKIPTYVRGSLFRNGPAKYQIGEYKMKHLFDGMAAVQRWTIAEDKVTYQRTFIKSETFLKNMEANRIVFAEYGTREVPDPCKNIFQRFFSLFTPHETTDNTAVTVWPQKDRVFVSTETHKIHEVDPETLETKDTIDLTKIVAVNQSTAHTHWTEDGTVYSVGLNYKGKAKHCVIEIPPHKEKADSFANMKIVAETPCRWSVHPGYLHSFSVTENFFIYPDQTFTWSIPTLAVLEFHNLSVQETFSWKPTEKTLFRIVNKKTGKTPDFKYTSEAQFTFHHINSYEEDDHLILDMCAYKNAKIIDSLYLENFTEEKIADTLTDKELHGEVRRFVFPLKVDKETPMNENLVKIPGSKATAKKISQDEVYCEYEVLTEEALELPTVNYPKYNGRKYRYAYGVGYAFQNLVKLDVQEKTAKVWKPEEAIVSEPIFVPNPEQNSEDDGVVLSPVKTYGEGSHPYLIVLDGKTFTELARVEFDTPRFSLDFHGFFRAAENEK